MRRPTDKTDEELEEWDRKLRKNPDFMGYYLGEPFFKGDETHQRLQRAAENGTTVFEESMREAKKALKEIGDIIDRKHGNR